MNQHNVELWITNGAGLRVSSQFGFGVINAEAMVLRAKYWTAVPEQMVKEIFPAATSG